MPDGANRFLGAQEFSHLPVNSRDYPSPHGHKSASRGGLSQKEASMKSALLIGLGVLAAGYMAVLVTSVYSTRQAPASLVAARERRLQRVCKFHDRGHTGQVRVV